MTIFKEMYPLHWENSNYATDLVHRMMYRTEAQKKGDRFKVAKRKLQRKIRRAKGR